MAALFRAICALGYAERFALYERSDDPWPGVIYSLQMAASLDDLFADPSYVSDDESGFWCGDAWDREEEEREAASKYAAALIMFNFAWTAYEAAIEISAENLFPKDKVAVRARRLLQSEADQASMIVALDMSYRVAKHICSQFGFLKNELSTIEGKYGLTGAAAAAELVRIFRNHIVHGGDPLPPDDVWPCYRFYAVTRVILLLIQYLILRHVKDPGLPVPLSINRDELGEEPANDYLRNLHYGDARWRHRSPVRGGSEPHTTF